MTPNPTYADPVITGHRTPAGKLAVKATSGDVSTTKYVVGGYLFYVLSARVLAKRWSAAKHEFVDEPWVAIEVIKRTDNRDTALRAASRSGGTVYRMSHGELIPL